MSFEMAGHLDKTEFNHLFIIFKKWYDVTSSCYLNLERSLLVTVSVAVKQVLGLYQKREPVVYAFLVSTNTR